MKTQLKKRRSVKKKSEPRNKIKYPLTAWRLKMKNRRKGPAQCAHLSKDLSMEEKKGKVLDLRRQAYTYREIEAITGINYGTVRNYIISALEELKQEQMEKAELLRTMELQRLDKLLNKIEPQLKKGNLFAIDRALKIMERRAKYIPNMEVPQKVHLGNDKESPLIEAQNNLEDKLLKLIAGDKELIEQSKKFKNGTDKPSGYDIAPSLPLGALGVEEDEIEEEETDES